MSKVMDFSSFLKILIKIKVVSTVKKISMIAKNRRQIHLKLLLKILIQKIVEASRALMGNKFPEKTTGTDSSKSKDRKMQKVVELDG